MKLNLIFKRTNIDTLLTETKVVPIDIPELTGEGWYLSSYSDIVTYTQPKVAHPQNEKEKSEENNKEISEKSPNLSIETCINNKKEQETETRGYPKITLEYVESKLFKSNGKISLARINPGQEISAHLVYITESEKQEFFNDVKSTYGPRTNEYQLLEGHKLYDKWNSFITNRYQDYYHDNLIVNTIKYKNGKIVTK